MTNVMIDMMVSPKKQYVNGLTYTVENMLFEDYRARPCGNISNQ